MQLIILEEQLSKVHDYSLKGEIDFTLPKLINNLKNNLEIENIDGLSFTINKKIFNNTNYPKVDIKELPLPAYHLLDEKHVKGYEETVERGKFDIQRRVENIDV